MSGKYSPFEHLDAKYMWDIHLTKINAIDKWINECHTIIGQWWNCEFFDKNDFIGAIIELKVLCKQSGLDINCVHCSSRPTKHDCNQCKSKAE